jgi:hypothetical protein
MSRRWCSWDGQSSFIECTTRSGERVHTTSCNAVSRAVDCRRTFITAGLAVLGVSVAIRVLAVAQVVVPEVVVPGLAAVVGSDVVVAVGSSRCEVGGKGVSRGAIGWFGSECRRTRGAGGRFEAGEEVVVAVVDDVGVVDGADGAVDSGDGGDDRLVGVSS